MSTYDRYRYTNSLKAAKCGFAESTPYSKGMLPLIYSGYDKPLGTNRSIRDTASKHFTPGVLALHDVDIRKYEGDCPADQQVAFRYVGNQPRYNKDIKICGQIAAYNIYPYISSDITFPPSTLKNYESSALMEAYSNMSTPAVGLTENIVEASQTLNTMLSPVKLFRNLWKEFNSPRFLKKKYRINPKAWFSFASSRWLEYRYGFIPLMGSIDDMQELAEKQLLYKMSGLKVAKGGASISKLTSVNTVNNTWATGPDMKIKCHKRITTTSEEFITSGCYFVVSFNDWRRLQLLGLSPAQFLQNMWNFVPYSFVLDWIVNVGEWINRMVPDPSITYLGNYVSHVQRIKTEVLQYGYNLDYLGVPYACVQSGLHTFDAMNSKLLRTVNVPVPASPRLNVEILNIKRSLDAISLIWQRLPR